jgi:hypothetical protein
MRHSLRRSLRRLAMLGAGAALVTLAACSDDGTPLRPRVAGLDAEVVGAEVKLTWSNAPGTDRVVLLRRLNAWPAGAADPLATVVFEGNATSYDDDLGGLLPSTTVAAREYHYAVFPCAGSSCTGTAARDSVAPTLLQCLRAGGYVIWWRHASATVCADRTDLGTAATTTVPDWWKSCDANCPPAGMATARQMSPAGVTEATVIGDSFDDLGIPVGRVLSAEFCRCVQTAVLNDFGPAIEQVEDITFFVYDEANRCANSMAHVAAIPAAGTNTAIIGQAGFPGACPVLGELAWGEAAIYRPHGDGTAELMQRVPWDQWSSLVPVMVDAVIARR